MGFGRIFAVIAVIVAAVFVFFDDWEPATFRDHQPTVGDGF